MSNARSLAAAVASLLGVSAQGAIPAGAIFDFAGSTPPAGYLLAAGQNVSRTTYPALYLAIGTTYGVGDGSTTFTLPDARGRVFAGKDNMGGTTAGRMTSASGVVGTTLGAVGGTETHVLTTAQMPVHNHGVNDPTHMHTYTDSAGGVSGSTGHAGGVYTGATNTSAASTGITIQNNGSGSAHPNVQPTLVVNKIIKT